VLAAELLREQVGQDRRDAGSTRPMRMSPASIPAEVTAIWYPASHPPKGTNSDSHPRAPPAAGWSQVTAAATISACRGRVGQALGNQPGGSPATSRRRPRRRMRRTRRHQLLETYYRI